MILPLRLYSATLPRRISAIIRKPSYLSSKTQPRSSNGASVSVASMGCRRLGRVDVRLICGPILQNWLRRGMFAFTGNAPGRRHVPSFAGQQGRGRKVSVTAAIIDGGKTQDLANVAGLLRPGDHRSV